MKAVLYADNMDPITVIEVPIWVLNLRFNVFEVAVPRAISPMVTPCNSDPAWDAELPILSIKVEWFVRKGRRHPMFFTDNDELALLLRPEFLAGQISDFRRQFEAGFIFGLLTAM